ncbi:hypothetical protein [Bosea lathyri]|uniref:Uncharacterized protein n=1 Tax=Bosea lathyri TaxID=1036778 RepID=A0A1H5TJH7_9HYPH|nr:hypothetical protein [Bosea lathyri]SEF62940.1 hypothetical protein SAMN04488115_101681 [Bosea lathyri]
MSATIAARAHTGSSLSAPARRAAPARRKAPWLARVGRMVLRRPGRAFVLLVFAAVAVAILANALMFQKARHPAPMVSAPTQTPAARSAERRAEPQAVPAAPSSAAATPTAAQPSTFPPSRPSDLSQNARETAPRPPAAVTSIPRTAAAPVAPAPAPVARAAPARDPIADLINGADIRPPGEIRGVAAARASAPRRSAEN